MGEAMRTFNTGATRNADSTKLDFEGFLSPLALEGLAEYMNFHRQLEDGSLRASDNWQLGIPISAYVKSLLRHVHDLWKAFRGHPTREGEAFAICGALFNLNGILHERLKADPEYVRNAVREHTELRAARWRAKAN